MPLTTNVNKSLVFSEVLTLNWLIFLLVILSGCNRSKKSYWDNGTLRSDLNYKDGKLNGPAVWYFENGLKEQEANYVNNKLNGVMKRWYTSGIPESVSNYNHGLLDGMAITYDEGGAKTNQRIVPSGQNSSVVS